MAVSPQQDQHPEDDAAGDGSTRATPRNLLASKPATARLRNARIPTERGRTIATAMAATVTIAAAAACSSQTHSGASSSVAAHPAAAISTRDANPTCTTTFPGGSGITVQHGQVTGAVTLHCNGTPDVPLISLTLAYAPPGQPLSDGREAAGRTFQETQAKYTVSTACLKPGTYVQHVLYGASVDGTALANHQWGTGKTITAADCDGAS